MPLECVEDWMSALDPKRAFQNVCSISSCPHYREVRFVPRATLEVIKARYTL